MADVPGDYDVISETIKRLAAGAIPRPFIPAAEDTAQASLTRIVAERDTARNALLTVDSMLTAGASPGTIRAVIEEAMERVPESECEWCEMHGFCDPPNCPVSWRWQGGQRQMQEAPVPGASGADAETPA